MRSRASAGTPGPLSSTIDAAPRPRRRVGLDARCAISGSRPGALGRLHGVLDQVRQHAPDQHPVAQRAHRRRAARRSAGSGCHSACARTKSSTTWPRSTGRRLDLGQLGEGREVVDQAADRADLLAQDLLRGRQQARVGRVVAAVLRAQLLDRELDRRERVLDLVRQAARHLLPGRHLLQVFQARARVAELGHHAVEGAPQLVQLVLAARRDAHGQVALADPAGRVAQRGHAPGRAPRDEQPQHGRERQHDHQRDAQAAEDAGKHQREAARSRSCSRSIASRSARKFAYISREIPKVSSSRRGASRLASRAARPGWAAPRARAPGPRAAPPTRRPRASPSMMRARSRSGTSARSGACSNGAARDLGGALAEALLHLREVRRGRPRPRRPASCRTSSWCWSVMA